MDDPGRRKFHMDESTEEEEEEEEERYDHFRGGSGNILPPTYHVRRGHGSREEKMDAYLDDDMESQKDGSVISRTAIYVWGEPAEGVARAGKKSKDVLVEERTFEPVKIPCVTYIYLLQVDYKKVQKKG